MLGLNDTLPSELGSVFFIGFLELNTFGNITLILSWSFFQCHITILVQHLSKLKNKLKVKSLMG
jgi:hypothetical protein